MPGVCALRSCTASSSHGNNSASGHGASTRLGFDPGVMPKLPELKIFASNMLIIADHAEPAATPGPDHDRPPGWGGSTILPIGIGPPWRGGVGSCTPKHRLASSRPRPRYRHGHAHGRRGGAVLFRRSPDAEHATRSNPPRVHQPAPTDFGRLYAWEFGKDGRELNVRVDGQLVFNEMSMILKAA